MTGAENAILKWLNS